MIVLLKCAVDEELERIIRSFLFDSTDLLWYEDELETLAASAVVEDIGRYFRVTSSISH